MPSRKVSLLKRIGHCLGPGVTTGAADDDPSGIATYSITGAQFGNQFLWSALLTWPLMACVQMMCARIGMVTGVGLAGAFRQKFPRWLVGAFAFALLVANVINIASDLAGMGAAVQMLVGGPSKVYVAVFGIGIGIAAVRLTYRQLALGLQWLALALFAYVVTAFAVDVDWKDVLHATFIPTLPSGREGWQTLVAILGTTISPYLFYWQAAQEVEEERAKGRRLRVHRLGATSTEIRDRRLDVGIGTFFSNLIMFFIIVTTASALHASGHTQIASTREAAEALKPLAGEFSYWLFSLGLVGTGLLAIPTLAGSAAYAFAETFDWAYGLDKKFKRAPSFYAVFLFATVLGVTIDLVGINAMRALFWSAVVNGVLAPILLVCIYLVATDEKIMVGQPARRPLRMVVLAATALMFAAAVGMFAL